MNTRYTGRRKTSPYDPPLSTALVPNRRNLGRFLLLLSLLLCGVFFVSRSLGGSSTKDRASLDVGKVNGRVIARDWESGKYLVGATGKGRKDKVPGGANELPMRGRGWKAMANKLNAKPADEVVLVNHLPRRSNPAIRR